MTGFLNVRRLLRRTFLHILICRPKLNPVYELPEIKEWIAFDHVFDKKDITGKGVHFFVDDYKFERLWNNPNRYITKNR